MRMMRMGMYKTRRRPNNSRSERGFRKKVLVRNILTMRYVFTSRGATMVMKPSASSQIYQSDNQKDGDRDRDRNRNRDRNRDAT